MRIMACVGALNPAFQRTAYHACTLLHIISDVHAACHGACAHVERARGRDPSRARQRRSLAGRRHRQRIGAHSRMQSFSHIMPYNFLYARCMACNMAEFEACRTRGSAHFFQRNWRAPGYVRRCARRIKQRTTARRCMAIVIYMYYQVRVI